MKDVPRYYILCRDIKRGFVEAELAAGHAHVFSIK